MSPDPKGTTPAQRHGLMHAHLPLFLTKDGELWRDSAFGREMADYLTRIVVVGSRRAAGKRPGTVVCNSHAVVGRCPGLIETKIERKPVRLDWWCPACGYSGSITGWEGTRWDRSTPGRRRQAVTTKKSVKRRGKRS